MKNKTDNIYLTVLSLFLVLKEFTDKLYINRYIRQYNTEGDENLISFILDVKPHIGIKLST